MFWECLGLKALESLRGPSAAALDGSVEGWVGTGCLLTLDEYQVSVSM